VTTLLCRLCWKRRPTGEARRLETDSYVAEHGFGHEEWLFNQEWTLDGKRHGFIQGLNSSRATYAGQTVALQLYTRRPSGLWCKVASIPSAYVLTNSETAEVAVEMRRRGWLASMQADLVKLGVKPGLLARASAPELSNIRFTPDVVELLDPPEPFSDQVTFGSKYRRYSAFKLAGRNLLSTARLRAGRRPASHPKPTQVRQRRGIPATSLDPKHDRLQNAVYEFLFGNYSQVESEADWVDLRATVAGRQYLFEIKAASTAKRCIREALGQLVEYTHYPDRDRNSPLVVVGDAKLSEADRIYLALLRRRYSLQIQYARWDWENHRLLGFPNPEAV